MRKADWRRVSRCKYRPTIGRSWCGHGRDPARGLACRRRRFWLIRTHERQGAPAAAPATSTRHQPSGSNVPRQRCAD
jgi:hypothetical protein